MGHARGEATTTGEPHIQVQGVVVTGKAREGGNDLG